jgi:hypothetical protein
MDLLSGGAVDTSGRGFARASMQQLHIGVAGSLSTMRSDVSRCYPKTKANFCSKQRFALPARVMILRLSRDYNPARWVIGSVAAV